MVVYSLDLELRPAEHAELELAVGESVEAIRIPWLGMLRATDENTPIDPDRFRIQLRHVGADRESGRRVLLLQPAHSPTCSALLEALRRLTGAYPLLVQTPERRRALGVPGPLRILDVEAYVLDTDSNTQLPFDHSTTVEGIEFLPPELRPDDR